MNKPLNMVYPMKSKNNWCYLNILMGFAVALLLYSCGSSKNQINGAGLVKKKTIKIENKFKAINLKGGWEVTLVEADENKLEVEANENLITALKHQVNRKKLLLGTSKNINRADAKKITLYHSENLEDITANSGSSVSSKDKLKQRHLTIEATSGATVDLMIKTRHLKIDASSGSNVKISGKSHDVEANISSKATLNAKKLEVYSASLETSSRGNIRMEVTNELTAKASSSGAIYYYSNPKKVSLDRSSSGTIERK